MKPTLECLLCIQNRVIGLLKEVKKMDDDEVLTIMKEVMKFLITEFDFNKTTTWIGSERERLIKKLLKDNDPYKEIKSTGNKIAKKIWNEIKHDYSTEWNFQTFKKYVYLVAAANAMEWFIKGYSFDENEFKETLNNVERYISTNGIEDLWEDINNAKLKKILYVLDNAGEAVFDLEFIRYLTINGYNVTIGARGENLINDVSYDDALELGFQNYGKVISIGKYAGIYLDEETPIEFRKALVESDVVILKGMGNFEGVIEYKLNRNIYVLLKAKCNPVARLLGVPRGSIVIRKLSL